MGVISRSLPLAGRNADLRQLFSVVRRALLMIVREIERQEALLAAVPVVRAGATAAPAARPVSPVDDLREIGKELFEIE